MLKKISALFAAAALALGVGVSAAQPAHAADLPPAPVINFHPATTPDEEDSISLSWPTEVADKAPYRYVVFGNGTYLKQLNKTLRGKLHSGDRLSASEIIGAQGSALDTLAGPGKTRYDIELRIKPYYHNNGKYKIAGLTNDNVHSSITNFVKLSEGTATPLTDPATLVPPTPPKQSDRPAAVPFSMTAPACTLGATVDNALQVNGDLGEQYRFVVSAKLANGNAVFLLSEAATAKLRAGTALSTAELQAAFGDKEVPFGTAVTVQQYWYDAADAYDPTLYDEDLLLTEGDEAKLIKIGDPQTLTLVDPATVVCPENPAPVEFVLGHKSCVAGKPKADEYLIKLTGELQENHRIVATIDGKSLSLKTSLRELLNTKKQLTIADFVAAYPNTNFADYYGKVITVQGYWFDKEKHYPADRWVTGLEPLLPGKTFDRFVVASQAQEESLSDPAALTCGSGSLPLHNTPKPIAEAPKPEAATPELPIAPKTEAGTQVAPQKPAAKTLAKTGADETGAALLGGCAMLAGAALLVARRRAR